MRPCPFPVPRLPPLLAALALACTPPTADPEPASSTSTTTATTSIPTTTTTTPTSTTTDLTSTTTLATTTTPEPDLFAYLACDPYAQDCPPGQKCAPYAVGGSAWNATKCVDITGDGAPNDPCIAPEGGAAGLDDCARGSFCWDVDKNNAGTCVAQCSGSVMDPLCPAWHLCTMFADGALAICLPICDPLTDDCGVVAVCAFNGYAFACMFDLSGDQGQTNDPCEDPSACDDGLTCLDAASASLACDPQSASGCCQPLCALPDGACPNPDQQCKPWFTPDNPAPPGYYDNLGVCALPP